MYKGLPPDENAKRKRTHPDQVPAAQLEEHGELLGPELNEEERDWHPRTRLWWQTWRRSPQAKLFLDTDWVFLHETAFLYDQFWDPNVSDTYRIKVSAEIRLRVEKFGATYSDRLKLRMRVPKVPAKETTTTTTSTNVTPMADYRARLGA